MEDKKDYLKGWTIPGHQREKLERFIDLIMEKNGLEIVVVDLRPMKTGLADFFIIAGGYTEDHLEAIALHIEESMEPLHEEGLRSKWVALDYFDIIIHLMTPDYRKHYDLEGLWAGAPQKKVESDGAE